MTLLGALAILFSDDPSIPISIRHEADQIKVEDVDHGILRKDCRDFIKEIQQRNLEQIKRNKKVLEGSE